MNLLYPKFSLRLLPAMLGHAVLGALVAGLYGVVHDQITYTLSTEYFTNLKFDQFCYADLGWPTRGFVAEIGFLATWWVGFFAAWFIARVTVPAYPGRLALRRSLQSFGIVFAVAACGALTGYVMGVLHGPNYGPWQPLAEMLQVRDVRSFVCVAYIHNAGYLGGLAGLVVALLVLVWRRRAERAQARQETAEAARGET